MTGTPVGDWLALPVRYLETAIDVLTKQARDAERADRRSRR